MTLPRWAIPWTLPAATPPWEPRLTLIRREPQLTGWTYYGRTPDGHRWERQAGPYVARVWYAPWRRDQPRATVMQRQMLWMFQRAGVTTRWLHRDTLCRQLLSRWPLDAAWIRDLHWDAFRVEGEPWR